MSHQSSIDRYTSLNQKLQELELRLSWHIIYMRCNSTVPSSTDDDEWYRDLYNIMELDDIHATQSAIYKDSTQQYPINIV